MPGAHETHQFALFYRRPIRPYSYVPPFENAGITGDGLIIFEDFIRLGKKPLTNTSRLLIFLLTVRLCLFF